MKAFNKTLLIIILLTLFIGITIFFQERKPYSKVCPTNGQNSSESKLLILGSNLGVWGDDWYWKVNEPFIKNSNQRKLAKGVIGSFRFPCRNVSDEGLLTVLDKIDEVGALPFVVLPANDDTRAEHVVELFGDRVQYYEYGNEVESFLNVEDYAKRFCEEYPKLKAINPDIKLGGPAQGTTDIEYYDKWAKALKESCPDVNPDFISFHKYWAYNNESSEDILNRVDNFGYEIEAIRNATEGIFNEDLPLIVSEWNWHAVPEYYGDSRDANPEFMERFTKSVIDVMENHGIFMAHQYCYGSGCGGGHLDMVSGSEPKPQYQAFLDKKMEFYPEC